MEGNELVARGSNTSDVILVLMKDCQDNHIYKIWMRFNQPGRGGSFPAFHHKTNRWLWVSLELKDLECKLKKQKQQQERPAESLHPKDVICTAGSTSAEWYRLPSCIGHEWAPVLQNPLRHCCPTVMTSLLSVCVGGLRSNSPNSDARVSKPGCERAIAASEDPPTCCGWSMHNVWKLAATAYTWNSPAPIGTPPPPPSTKSKVSGATGKEQSAGTRRREKTLENITDFIGRLRWGTF